MARNWEEMGITWETAEVSRRVDKNDSSKVSLGNVELPRVVNIDAVIGAKLSEALLAGVNGTSWRVTAQDVGRTYRESLKRQSDYNIEENRERVYRRLCGIRNPMLHRSTTVYNLPDGTTYSGNNETELQQRYTAALVEKGVDAATALAIGSTQKLQK